MSCVIKSFCTFQTGTNKLCGCAGLLAALVECNKISSSQDKPEGAHIILRLKRNTCKIEDSTKNSLLKQNLIT